MAELEIYESEGDVLTAEGNPSHKLDIDTLFKAQVLFHSRETPKGMDYLSYFQAETGQEGRGFRANQFYVFYQGKPVSPAVLEQEVERLLTAKDENSDFTFGGMEEAFLGELASVPDQPLQGLEKAGFNPKKIRREVSAGNQLAFKVDSEANAARLAKWMLELNDSVSLAVAGNNPKAFSYVDAEIEIMVDSNTRGIEEVDGFAQENRTGSRNTKAERILEKQKRRNQSWLRRKLPF